VNTTTTKAAVFGIIDVFTIRAGLWRVRNVRITTGESAELLGFVIHNDLHYDVLSRSSPHHHHAFETLAAALAFLESSAASPPPTGTPTRRLDQVAGAF
jgi:hypothetical protein